MTTKEIILKVWQENDIIVLSNHGEADSRYLKVSFEDAESNKVSLQGKSVTFYAQKPDGTKVFNSCDVDSSENVASVLLTSQILSSAGILECEFEIFDSSSKLLKVNGIKIIVADCTDFSEAIESTSEYNALVEAINQAESFSNSIGSISDLNTTSKNTLVGAINEINTKVIPVSQGGTGATTAEGARSALEVKKEYVLYSNSSGTSNTITLSDQFTNYDKIKIYYHDNQAYNMNEFSPSQASLVVLDNTYIGTGSEPTTCYTHSALVKFSGSSVSFSRNGLALMEKPSSISVSSSSSQGIQVTKISGYKY